MKFDYGSYGYIALRDLEDARNSVSTMPNSIQDSVSGIHPMRLD